MKVFCITTVRSGSKYLAKIFKCAKETSAHHEPQPIGQVHRLTLNVGTGDPETVEFLEKKIEVINDKETKHYIETNHCFIKSFWNIVTSFDEVKVIRLLRDPYLVIKSFYSWNRIPGNKNWHLSPFASNNMIPYVVRDTAVNRLIWYIQEIDARAKMFEARYPSIPVYTVDVEELNNISSVDKIFKWLKIEYSHTQVEKVIRDRFGINTKIDSVTEKRSIDFTREEYLEALQAYLFNYYKKEQSSIVSDVFISNFKNPTINEY